MGRKITSIWEKKIQENGAKAEYCYDMLEDIAKLEGMIKLLRKEYYKERIEKRRDKRMNKTEIKNTCEIIEMPASSIRTKLSSLLKLANILQETECEIVIMNNQVTILPKRKV